MSETTIEPSLKKGQRVRYTVNGILSACQGAVDSWRFNPTTDQFEYFVHWDNDAGVEPIARPRTRLQPIPDTPVQ